jgi:NADPH:quinone reductase-like Zn-dependent oxidoreductase
VVGGEGVGRLPDGRIAYFDSPQAPFGSIAERCLIAEEHAIPLPDGLDPALAVCFGVAGLAAWLALEWRAQLQPGETVLVLGASGVVGQLAVQGAKLMGAGRVVAAGRSREGLAPALEHGADAAVILPQAADLAQAFRESAGGDINVIIDPVWGEPAAAAVEAAAEGARVVQLGQSAGATSELSSAAIRGKLLSILGHTNFRAPPEVKRAAYRRMAEHGAAGELTVDVEQLPLERVQEAWERQAASPGHKLVIVPSAPG